MSRDGMMFHTTPAEKGSDKITLCYDTDKHIFTIDNRNLMQPGPCHARHEFCQGRILLRGLNG